MFFQSVPARREHPKVPQHDTWRIAEGRRSLPFQENSAVGPVFSRTRQRGAIAYRIYPCMGSPCGAAWANHAS